MEHSLLLIRLLDFDGGGMPCNLEERINIRRIRFLFQFPMASNLECNANYVEMLRYHQWGDRLPPELFREWGGEMSEQASYSATTAFTNCLSQFYQSLRFDFLAFYGGEVCNEIYGPMYVNHGDGSRSIESPFQLSEETID